MKYAETGFRALYHNFAVFPLMPVTGKALAGFEGAETAEGVLVYGYIDHEAGLTLEVLAPAGRDKEYWRFTDGNDEIRSFIRMEAVAEEEFTLINNEDGRLSARYAKKLEMLKVYDVSKEIEKSRTFGFLDGCRDPQYIDDVLVTLTEDGLKPEACWARIIGLSEHRIRAKLLNEPDQDFTIHQGENFAFYVHQDEETGEISCMARFSPIEKISPEELADGKQLKTAIHQFREGILTLPVLYAMEKEEIRPQIVELIRSAKAGNFSSEDAGKLTRLTVVSGGMRRAVQDMEKHMTMALGTIENLPDHGVSNVFRELLKTKCSIPEMPAPV